MNETLIEAYNDVLTDAHGRAPREVVDWIATRTIELCADVTKAAKK